MPACARDHSYRAPTGARISPEATTRKSGSRVHISDSDIQMRGSRAFIKRPKFQGFTRVAIGSITTLCPPRRARSSGSFLESWNRVASLLTTQSSRRLHPISLSWHAAPKSSHSECRGAHGKDQNLVSWGDWAKEGDALEFSHCEC
jgi:hypothetical protein